MLPNLSLKLTLRVDTLRPQLRRLLSNLDGEGRRKVLEAGARAFWQSTIKNFGTTGGDRPNEWRSLSPGYQRRIKYFGPPLLVRGGALIKSIKWRVVSSNEAVIWTDSRYGAAHQFGRPRLPRRSFFPVQGRTEIMPRTRSLMERMMEEAALK